MTTLTHTVVGFARTLRACGVDATPDRVHAMLAALGHLDAARRDDVYWSGRLTLCGGPDDVVRYDRAFDAYFAGRTASPVRRPPAVEIVLPVAVPAEGGEPDASSGDAERAATASTMEVLRKRDVASLSNDERDELHRLLALLDAPAPLRTSRRYTAAHHGAIDVHRTVRSTLRSGGETTHLLHRARRTRPRRLVMIVDVSGSMSPYADAMLRFAHASARRRAGTEVFTLGTRLTRVTHEMRARDPDVALAELSRAVPDWSGGTRLGELIKDFLDRWGQRGTARGAVVVIASDGWERGDPSLLGEQMARLARLAHRVVWVNPHKGRPGFQPRTAGMQAALPHVHDFVEGHSLAALEELAGVVSGRVAGHVAGGSRRA